MEVVYRDKQRHVVARVRESDWVPPAGTEITLPDGNFMVARSVRYDPTKSRCTVYCVTPAELRREADQIDRS